MITRYDWILDTKDETGGPYSQSGKVVIQNYGGKDGEECSDEKVENQLTVVDADGRVSSITLTYKFPEDSIRLRELDDAPLDSWFTTLLVLETPGGSSIGTLNVNGEEARAAAHSAASTHRYRGARGLNTLEARVVGATGEGFWTFDFSGAEHFVTGSFQVQSGQVTSRSGNQITFRVGETAPPIVFRYQLDAADRSSASR